MNTLCKYSDSVHVSNKYCTFPHAHGAQGSDVQTLTNVSCPWGGRTVESTCQKRSTFRQHGRKDEDRWSRQHRLRASSTSTAETSFLPPAVVCYNFLTSTPPLVYLYSPAVFREEPSRSHEVRLARCGNPVSVRPARFVGTILVCSASISTTKRAGPQPVPAMIKSRPASFASLAFNLSRALSPPAFPSCPLYYLIRRYFNFHYHHHCAVLSMVA
jgi:hypothetical protein